MPTPGQTDVMTVPEAGARLGLGRDASYAAAARGDIPVIKIGKFLRVPRIAFERMLESAGDHHLSRPRPIA
jgi:excisionase family DNA binding protein